LELALENFTPVPSYAKKEILVIFSSITNCDPSNIFDTYNKLNARDIKCSVISLSAAIHILQKLATTTNGEFHLAKDEAHFKELIKRFRVPSDSK